MSEGKLDKCVGRLNIGPRACVDVDLECLERQVALQFKHADRIIVCWGSPSVVIAVEETRSPYKEDLDKLCSTLKRLSEISLPELQNLQESVYYGIIHKKRRARMPVMRALHSLKWCELPGGRRVVSAMANCNEELWSWLERYVRGAASR